MKINKKISLVLVFALVFSMFSTFTAFAAATEFAVAAEGANVVQLGSNNLDRYNKSNGAAGDISGSYGASIYLGNNGWAEYKLSVTSAGSYSVALQVDANSTTANIWAYAEGGSVDDVESYISNASIAAAAGNTVTGVLGNVNLTAGYNIVRVQVTGAQTTVRQIILTRTGDIAGDEEIDGVSIKVGTMEFKDSKKRVGFMTPWTVKGTGTAELLLIVTGYSDTAATRHAETKYLELTVDADAQTISYLWNNSTPHSYSVENFIYNYNSNTATTKGLSASYAAVKAFLINKADYSPIAYAAYDTATGGNGTFWTK